MHLKMFLNLVWCLSAIGEFFIFGNIFYSFWFVWSRLRLFVWRDVVFRRSRFIDHLPFQHTGLIENIRLELFVGRQLWDGLLSATCRCLFSSGWKYWITTLLHNGYGFQDWFLKRSGSLKDVLFCPLSYNYVYITVSSRNVFRLCCDYHDA